MSEEQKKSFIDGYISFLEITARDGSIGPALPAMALDTDDKLSVFALMVSPVEAFDHMVKYIKEHQPVQVAFALDRFSKEGQRVDEKYDSVFTFYHMRADKKWGLGVFPYNKKGEYGSVDWHNIFWKEISTEVIAQLSALSKKVYHGGEQV